MAFGRHFHMLHFASEDQRTLPRACSPATTSSTIATSGRRFIRSSCTSTDYRLIDNPLLVDIVADTPPATVLMVVVFWIAAPAEIGGSGINGTVTMVITSLRACIAWNTEYATPAQKAIRLPCLIVSLIGMATSSCS